MKNKVKNSPFNIVLLTICSFVGVGFITGVEIWFYFARFGLNMIFGVIYFTVLTFLLVYFALGESDAQNDRFIQFKRQISAVSELLIASAMISGLAEQSRLIFGNGWLIVFLISISIVFCLLWLGLKSFIFYNYFVAIFIVFVVIVLFRFNNNFLLDFEPKFSLNLSLKSIVFAGVYIFMNIAEIKPILSEFSEKQNEKKKVLTALFVTGSLVFLMITLSFVLQNNRNISQNSMPFLLLFNNFGGVVEWVFLVGLIMTLISTAVACLIGVKNKLILKNNDEKFCKIIVIISALILGQIPFLVFIKIIYPIIAIFSFILFIFEFIFKRGKKMICK